MLTRELRARVGRPLALASRVGQRGVVLIISLIILVAMTIGGIALLRSVDTTGLIAGNLAFQQAAARAGEAGTEDAIRFVLEALPADRLWNNYAGTDGRGYVASTPASGNPDSWEDYWRTTVNPNPVANSFTEPIRKCVDRVCTLHTDAAGNTPSYTIQRLCQTAGDPQEKPTGCASATKKKLSEGENLDATAAQYSTFTQYYYRITTRVVGPRNTTSYIQTIVVK